MSTPIDFDTSDGLKLFRGAYDAAYDHQEQRNVACERWYQVFHGFLDMTTRNPALANISIPKIWSIIRTNVPKEVRAAIGRRPYIDFKPEREDFDELGRLQVKAQDQLLELGGFPYKFVVTTFLKSVFGTGFLENRPYYQHDIQEILMPKISTGYDGMPRVDGWDRTAIDIYRLRYKLTPYAPWEFLVDPMAVGIEDEEGCRYGIKIQIASKRAIKKLAMGGAYGKDFDADRLDAVPDDYGTELHQHRGHAMLRSMGYTLPEADSDIGVLYRYESPDSMGRYMDVWNDRVILRDGPNPYVKDKITKGHGLINISRMIHNIDPHTQMQMWGEGDVGILEQLGALLNDLFNMTLNNHMFANMGKSYYARGRGISEQDLVHQAGAMVSVDVRDGERLDDLVRTDYGQNLPSDHYNLLKVVEDFMDLTVNQYEVNRGETSKGDQTLGELGMLREAGDTRQELNVKLIEDLFLKDFGHKALCHNRQWLKDDDVEELLGEEDAEKFALAHPGDLPGGYNMSLTGSDRVVNQQVKQRALAVLAPEVAASPFVNLREWHRIRFEAHDLGDEVDAVFITEEEMAMRQQQMLQQAPVPGEPEGSVPAERDMTQAGQGEIAGRLMHPTEGM